MKDIFLTDLKEAVDTFVAEAIECNFQGSLGTAASSNSLDLMNSTGICALDEIECRLPDAGGYYFVCLMDSMYCMNSTSFENTLKMNSHFCDLADEVNLLLDDFQKELFEELLHKG